MSERKYGHRGYLEDEPRETKRRGGSRPKRDGPRGRGLGRPTATRFKCARCGAAVRVEVETGSDAGIAQQTECTDCGSDLHTCINCRHFDTAAPLECRAEIKERIRHKSRRNSCVFFEPRLVQEHAAVENEEDPKAAFDALFDF